MGNKSSKSSVFSASDTVIAVIGPCGSGKSTFINKLTATNSLQVGVGLKPCTKQVQHVLHPEPEYGRLIFVDTPPFPDPDPKKRGTRHEEIRRIEKKIVEWLKKSFGRERIQVNGILYLYNIQGNRMTEPPRPHFEMFKKLCGDDYTGRVLLVATMWEMVKDQNVRESRKAILTAHWGEMVVEHRGTKESAWHIVKALLCPQLESSDLFESVNAVEEGGEKESAHKAERLAEENNRRIIMEEMEKARVAEGQVRELQRLREMEQTRIADEQAKELQSLRSLQNARLADEKRQENKRLWEQEKADKQEKERQQFDQVRIAAEQALERLFLKEEALLIAQHTEGLKRVQLEETGRIASEEKENERRRQDEGKACVTEQQTRNLGDDFQHMWEETNARFAEQIRKQERDRIAAEQRLREAEANRVKVRDRTVVSEPQDQGSESQEESNGEAVLEPARLAEEIRRRLSDKNIKINVTDSAAPSGNMHHPTLTRTPTPTPPILQPLPCHAHQGLSPYDIPHPHYSCHAYYGLPYFPSGCMGMHPCCYRQPSPAYGLPPPPTNVNHINVNMSNTVQ